MPTTSRSWSKRSTSRTRSMSVIPPAVAKSPAYIGRHGTKRVAKAALIGAVPPLMLKTAANPGGLPLEAFNELRANVLADRSQFFKDLSIPFYGYNRPGAKVSQGVRDSFWLQGIMASFPAHSFALRPFPRRISPRI